MQSALMRSGSLLASLALGGCSSQPEIQVASPPSPGTGEQALAEESPNSAPTLNLPKASLYSDMNLLAGERSWNLGHLLTLTDEQYSLRDLACDVARVGLWPTVRSYGAQWFQTPLHAGGAYVVHIDEMPPASAQLEGKASTGRAIQATVIPFTPNCFGAYVVVVTFDEKGQIARTLVGESQSKSDRHNQLIAAPISPDDQRFEFLTQVTFHNIACAGTSAAKELNRAEIARYAPYMTELPSTLCSEY